MEPRARLVHRALLEFGRHVGQARGDHFVKLPGLLEHEDLEHGIQVLALGSVRKRHAVALLDVRDLVRQHRGQLVLVAKRTQEPGGDEHGSAGNGRGLGAGIVIHHHEREAKRRVRQRAARRDAVAHPVDVRRHGVGEVEHLARAHPRRQALAPEDALFRGADGHGAAELEHQFIDRHLHDRVVADAVGECQHQVAHGLRIRLFRLGDGHGTLAQRCRLGGERLVEVLHAGTGHGQAIEPPAPGKRIAAGKPESRRLGGDFQHAVRGAVVGAVQRGRRRRKRGHRRAGG